MLIQGTVGVQTNADGANNTVRTGKQGDLLVSQYHGRFYEANLRGNLYSGGMVTTSISNAVFTVATTDATTKGIVGIYNPSTSGVNAVILQAIVNITVTAATSTGCGGLTWQTATGQSAISTGNAPLNRKTLLATGSQIKDLSGLAATGLTGAFVNRQGSACGGGSLANFSFVGTAVGQVTPAFTAVENIDGSIIVPPGGVLMLCANTTPVAHSATSAILWEEVAV